MTRFTDHGLAWLTLDDPRTLGGPGSGNFGHAGRPGEVGGSAEGGFGVHARVYRGGVQQDASVSFKGFVYVSTNQQNAKQWGTVQEYEITRPQKLVNLDDWNAPGSKQLVAYIQGIDQAQMSLLDFQDEAVQVFVQGDPRIIPWLTKHGYTGMRYGDDAALVGALTDHAKLTTAGGPGSGNFGHAGRPGEVGGSAPGDVKSFSSEEGYTWHEQGPVADWAIHLPYADHRALTNYSSFGYHSINDVLRGTPPMHEKPQREMTKDEVKAYVKAREAGDTPVPPEGGWYTFRAGTGDEPSGWVVMKKVVDEERVVEATAEAKQLNDLIANRGYVLPESVELGRAAYFPGVSFEDLQASVGTIREEKGFTSTMAGDAQGRLTSYVASGKFESIYNRSGGKSGSILAGQDEVGSACRIHIVVPDGTKVASIESSRRLEFEHPRIQDPEVFNHPEWLTSGLKPEDFKIRDITATPKVNADRLKDKNTRSESEVLLGSGARYRVERVERDGEYKSGDESLKPVPIIDMYLVYVGGGSSDPKGQRS